MSKKSYLLAPTRDCPPSGPIALGNIIASPFSPEIALNTTPSRPFPPTVVVNRRVETDWVTSLNTSKGGKVGVYMQFCQMLGIGGNINIGARQTTSNTFAFEELQTISIFPDAAYIETRLQSPGVKEFVREHKFKKNVYMIIGVKIAKKGRIRTAIQKERSLYLQIGIDGTVAQLPFDAGPTIDISRTTEESTSSNISEDFVLAFRLREIYYDKKKKNASQREYDKGALFGIDDDEGMEFESLGLAEDDVEADDLDINGQPGVDDDGEECECGILQEVDT